MLRGILGPPRTDGGNQRLIIEVDAQGEENAFGFSLRFNAARWRFVSATVSSEVRDAALHVNANRAADGNIGVALALPAGHALRDGTRHLLVVEFAPLPQGQSSLLTVDFGDVPILRETADINARPVPTSYAVESVVAGAAKKHLPGEGLRLAQRE
jgi:hypothetical protein